MGGNARKGSKQEFFEQLVQPIGYKNFNLWFGIQSNTNYCILHS